jgi:hypothetical protein
MTQEEMSLWKKGHFHKIQTYIFLHLTLSRSVAKYSLEEKGLSVLPTHLGLGNSGTHSAGYQPLYLVC